MSHPYRPEIEYVTSTGLMCGYEDGTFRPEEPVRRLEMAVILAQAAQPDGAPGIYTPILPCFPDVPPVAPWYDDVESVYSRGIMGPYSDGLFHPEMLCSTAEAEEAVAATFEVRAADWWSYPLLPWNVSLHRGTWVPGWGYHLGDDVPAAAGTKVKNARWGYVRHVGEHTKFGHVVIIESPVDWEPSTNPSTWARPVCHIYGHLQHDKYLDATIKKVGYLVDRGWIIGTLGDSSHNGGWPPHLHFGIRKGRYTSTWVYWGYSTSRTVLAQWYHPCTIIRDY